MFQLGREWYHALWSDDAVMLVSDYGNVYVQCRGGRRATSPTLYGIERVTAVGSGPAMRMAAVGKEGKLLTWKGGSWETGQVPAIGEEDLVGVAIASDGRIFAAGEKSALYIGMGNTWTTHAYPDELTEVTSSVMAADGRLLLGAKTGIYTFDGEHFAPLVPPERFSGEVSDLWQAPSGTVWAVTYDHVVEIRGSEVKKLDPPIFGRLRAITGTSTPDGDVVLIAAQSELAFLHKGKFLRADGRYSFPEELHLDAFNEVVYIAHRDGLTRVPFDHPAIVTKPRAASICPLPAGASLPVSTVRDTRTPVRLEKAELTPAKKGKPKDVRQPMPTLRLGFGTAIGKLPGESPTAGFAFDLMGGATVGVHPYISVFPEIGYGYTRLRGDKQHLFLAGVGPLFGNEYAAVGVVPRFAVGDFGELFAIGTRTALVGSFAYDVVALEVAHQWLRVGGEDLHEARITASINVLPLFAVIILAAALGRAGRRWRRRRY